MTTSNPTPESREPITVKQGAGGDAMSYPTSPNGTWNRHHRKRYHAPWESRYYGPTWVFHHKQKNRHGPSARARVETVARGYRLTVRVWRKDYEYRDVCDVVLTTRDEAMRIGMETCAAEMRALEVTL